MIATRRDVLRSLAAGLCAGSGVAAAQTPVLRVSFVPAIGAAPLFVVDRAGWAKEVGLSLALSRFDSGPVAIQAFASGNFDVLAIGVAPIAVARSKGLGAAIVCGGGFGGSSFIAAPNLAVQFSGAAGEPGASFAAFRREAGRRAKIATLPPGAVPAAALHHWLYEIGHVDPADVDIVALGIDAVQAAMLAGAVDGATVLEPSATLVMARNPKLKVIATALDMFPDLPGVAFAASATALAQRRRALVVFVRLVARATDLIRTQPQAAAPFVAEVLGGGIVEPAIMEAALRSRAVRFEADPRAMTEPARRLLAYQAKIGDFPQTPPSEGLFDFSVWDEAAMR